tara:strand:- start:2708 stop:3547 length:840 start_codon:yes stop_codon:yes gene_type:complete
MKNLIIGCASNYDWSTLQYWCNSINQSGFDGDKVLVLMNCDKTTVLKVQEEGFKIIAFNKDDEGNLTHESKMPPHVERFLHIYEYLRKADPYDWVVTTDVKDVIFQSDPCKALSEMKSDADLYFSSESILYKDEPWGDQNLLDTYGPYVHDIFKENEIYNVGVLGGTGEAMKSLMINIFSSCMGKPIQICDQSTFNFMISQPPYKKTSHYFKSEDGWACQLGTTVDPAKIDEFKPKLLEASPMMEGGIVKTSKGKPFTIVHQYDRVPAWRHLIQMKYTK